MNTSLLIKIVVLIMILVAPSRPEAKSLLTLSEKEVQLPFELSDQIQSENDQKRKIAEKYRISLLAELAVGTKKCPMIREGKNAVEIRNLLLRPISSRIDPDNLLDELYELGFRVSLTVKRCDEMTDPARNLILTPENKRK